MLEEKLMLVHLGEALQDEFLKPTCLSQHCVAIDIGVPAPRISEISLRKRRFTTHTALQLARYFSMSPQFWLGLQLDYYLDVAESALVQRLEREVQPHAVG